MLSYDETKRELPDGSRLDIHEENRLAYWSNKFGVTSDELRAAVRRAGTYVKDVVHKNSGS